MANRICAHGSSAPVEVLETLHESQAGQKDGVEIWRHKCCNCAFLRGQELGTAQQQLPGGNAECKKTGRRAPLELMDALPKSQAGLGRHQCAICAFHAGFERGRGMGLHP
jgi:hypothetical protein